MNVNEDYEKLMEDSLKDELEWLEEEFKLIFQNKKIKTKEDIAIGNQILDQVIDNIKTGNNENLLNLLAITLNKIESAYPEFF